MKFKECSESMVAIGWYDARFYPEMCNEEEIDEKKMCLFMSLGYLISTDECVTVLASEMNDEDKFRDITLIPTGSIWSISRLTIGSNIPKAKP